MYTHIHIQTYKYIHIQTYITSMYIYRYKCICMYVCMCVYICVYIYIYTHRMLFLEPRQEVFTARISRARNGP